MEIRCNDCMEEFEEEEIRLVMVDDEDINSVLTEEEACPICGKVGCLMDLKKGDK